MHFQSLLVISLFALLSHLSIVSSLPVPQGPWMNDDERNKHIRIRQYQEGPNHVIELLCETEPGELTGSCSKTREGAYANRQSGRFIQLRHSFTWGHRIYTQRPVLLLPQGYITANDKVDTKRSKGADGWEGYKMIFFPV